MRDAHHWACGPADARLGARDRVEHLQLRAVQVRHHRHAGQDRRRGVVDRGEVVQVQQPRARHADRIPRSASPTPPPSAHPAPATPTGTRGRARLPGPRTTDASETARPSDPRRAPSGPRRRRTRPARCRHRRTPSPRCPAPRSAQRPARQRDVPPVRRKRPRQVAGHLRRAAAGIEEQPHPHTISVTCQDHQPIRHIVTGYVPTTTVFPSKVRARPRARS